MLNLNSGWGQHWTQSLHNIKPTLGRVFFVGDSSTVDLDKVKEIFGVDPDGELRYYDDIDAAVSACTADRGDVILVAPGHTETVSSAGAISLDVSGISLIGLGEGTLVPTITLNTAATADIAVSANDIVVENFIFSANFADIANLFEISTAKNFTVRNCQFKATATNMNFLAIAGTNTTNNAADGLAFENCSWIEPDTATTSLVDVDADIDKLSVKNCYLNLGVNTSDLPALAYVATGKDLTNVEFVGNKIIRLNDANPLLADPDTTTANTGIVANNYVRHADTAAELLVTAGTVIGFFENKASAANDASGYTLPAADS